MYRVSYDYMLGIRSTYTGLMIDPAIPSHWKKFTAERVYRGTRYFIEVENNSGFQKGIKEIRVDGQLIKGNILPLTTNEVCEVKVVMG
jgi:cellobiose phosphorylase